MTSATEPPVRHRSSQSEDSEYSRTSGPSAQSAISLNAPLVITMASTRPPAPTTDSRYSSDWSANNCGLIAATIRMLMPRLSSSGSTLTRFCVGMVPRT